MGLMESPANCMQTIHSYAFLLSPTSSAASVNDFLPFFVRRIKVSFISFIVKLRFYVWHGHFSLGGQYSSSCQHHQIIYSEPLHHLWPASEFWISHLSAHPRSPHVRDTANNQTFQSVPFLFNHLKLFSGLDYCNSLFTCVSQSSVASH